jgi:hypothetical protein
MKPEEYFFVKKVDINEGLTTLTVTKAAMFFTKRFAFVVPVSDINILQSAESKWPDVKQFIEAMVQKAEDLELEQFQAEMFSALAENRIFNINELETFKISGGWLGGGVIKRRGDQRKTLNIPRKARKHLKNFYGI